MVDWTEAKWVPLTVGDGDDQFVAYARVGDVIGIRDSRLGKDSPVLEFTPTEWDAFVAGARHGEFDL
jgi:hypothetical protein